MSERELRTLFAKGTEDRPPGLALMPAIATRPTRRTWSLVTMAAAVGVAATVGTTVLVLLPANQPSAQAQVAAAVEHTDRDSFRVHITAGTRTFTGAFDPVRHVGVMTEQGDASETRFIGDRQYIRQSKSGQWEVHPRYGPKTDTPAATALVKLAPQDPQAALHKLRSATDVQEAGPASGPGWTGHRFTFSLKDERWPGTTPTSKLTEATGNVDVDAEGRVRRLNVTFKDNGQSDLMTFGDFGTRVTVTPPPADQVQQVPDDKPDVKPTGNPSDKPTRNPSDKPTDRPTVTTS